MAATEMASIVGGGAPEASADNAAATGTEQAETPQEGGEVSASPAQEKPEAAEIDPDEGAQDRHVPLKALKEERKKRQEYERRLAQLEGQLSAYQQIQQRSPAKETPKATDDDDQFFSGPQKFVRDTVEHRAAAVEKAVEAARFDLSEELARSRHEDYDETIAAFHEAVTDDPALLASFQAQVAADRTGRAKRNPAEFAYDFAKTFKEVGEVGSLSELKAKIEAEVRAKLETELRGNGAQAAASKVSPSTVSARGTGGKATPVFAPTPLASIARGTGV